MDAGVDNTVRKRRTASRQASRELLHPALEDLDPSTKFLYTPHTITGLLIGKSGQGRGLQRRGPLLICKLNVFDTMIPC